MSTQIVIMNRWGVAMCTDSALTVPGERGQRSVTNNGKKLFHVTKETGFMNYNAMSHCGLPVELVLKKFRKRIKGEAKATVSQCTKDFFEYLKSLSVAENHESDASPKQLARDLAAQIRAESGSLDIRMSSLMARVRREERLFQPGNGKAVNESPAFLARVLAETVGDSGEPLPPDAVKAFSEIWREAMSRRFRSTGYSGLVFAGYGEDEDFPCLEHWIIDGMHEGKLRYWKDQNSCVDLNTQGMVYACMSPFAQRDISDLLISGLDQGALAKISNASDVFLKNFLRSRYANLYGEREADRLISMDQGTVTHGLIDILNQSVHDRVESLLKRVSTLQIDDLAEIAEAFVKITSARRMIDADLRTVGGRTNIGVITKFDGFARIDEDRCFRPDSRSSFMRYLEKYLE